MNKGYEEGFCCHLGALMCRCIPKARAAGHGINSALFCCKDNPTICIVVHSVFHRHDLVTNMEDREDLAPEGYVLTKRSTK